MMNLKKALPNIHITINNKCSPNESKQSANQANRSFKINQAT